MEIKVEELLLQGVATGSHTLEQARITLEQWCKVENFDPWNALRLFEAQAKELGFDAKGLTLDQAQQCLKQAIVEGLKGSDVEALIADLSRQTGYPPQILQRIYGELEREADLETATERATADLEHLRAIQGQRLPFKEGLHGDGGALARKIAQVADAMPTAPEFLVTTLIPVLATAIGTAHTLVVHATAGYTVRAIFRSIIVAGTGRKKTPSQAAILEVLTKLEESAALDYQYELATYEQDYKEWLKASKSGDNPGPEPNKPTRRRYVSQDNTLAARVQIHKENPRGLLLYKDEASAFITERGRFNSGKGDGGELEADLSEFNGGAIVCDRKGDGSTFLPKTAINRVGATQFSALQRLMGAHEDVCGEFARYLFCAADAPPSKIDLAKDVGDIGLTSAVMQLFNDLLQLPEGTYLLSPHAKESFQAYQHELTDRQIAADHPSLQAAYPKFETYFGRFILWLHLVNAVLASRAPEPTVDGYTVELARRWTEYYIGQLKLVLAVNSPQQELTGDLFKVYNYLKRKEQSMGVREISQGRLFDRDTDKSKRRSPYLRELLSTLVEQGWIVQQDGLYSLNTLESPPWVEQNAQQNLDVEQNVEQMLSRPEPTQHYLGQGFSGFVERNVEQVEHNSVKQTNGHHHPDEFTSISDRELTELLGGGRHADG
ncbi:DUF3987 domain-containing protein [Phormidium tenue]|uniref:DUF3987 domain-containing protein n=1 Tax=Phormidium tenue NIES-30 TaxID=549789 RepID=A0A1U7IZQ9_9CYAN|nr:DUF3987 domain-containing protein [Phormidium tenue]MBD2234088.1 DUF3987 domain-containing protein [Phormidium tenue FACHB-1052]OKH44672.1 hypothetical protein NIES30_21915 [Phormidium tenue NIES-30]